MILQGHLVGHSLLRAHSSSDAELDFLLGVCFLSWTLGPLLLGASAATDIEVDLSTGSRFGLFPVTCF